MEENQNVLEDVVSQSSAPSLPTTADWFLMSSPWPTSIVFFAYVVFLKVLGPKLMNRKRFCNLTITLILYNLLQIGVNAWVIYRLHDLRWMRLVGLACEIADEAATEAVSAVLGVCWLYFLCKFLDLFTNILAVYDKRYDQVSWLNVLYEGFVLLSVWFVLNKLPGGHISVFVFIGAAMNLSTHLVKLLPSCKLFNVLLSLLRLMQAAALFLLSLEPMMNTDCPLRNDFGFWMTSHSAFLFVLFIMRFKKNRKRKTSLTRENSTHFEESTYVSFNNYGTDNSDLKKRYPIKAQV